MISTKNHSSGRSAKGLRLKKRGRKEVNGIGGLFTAIYIFNRPFNHKQIVGGEALRLKMFV